MLDGWAMRGGEREKGGGRGWGMEQQRGKRGVGDGRSRYHNSSANKQRCTDSILCRSFTHLHAVAAP
eukprot:722463-Hanusia_phi.AAC.1